MLCAMKSAQYYKVDSDEIWKTWFLALPYMKYFQLNVNLFLYHHKWTPYSYFFRLRSKTFKTLYLTICVRNLTNIIHQNFINFGKIIKFGIRPIKSMSELLRSKNQGLSPLTHLLKSSPSLKSWHITFLLFDPSG